VRKETCAFFFLYVLFFLSTLGKNPKNDSIYITSKYKPLTLITWRYYPIIISMAAASSHNATKPVLAYEEAGKPIRLVYDTWTPRPHFIAVQSQPTQNATDTELQVTYEIIGGFLRTNPQFDKEAILSFHCGKWYQQHTSEWHAHLCVPEQPYLEKARVEVIQFLT
jgi:hypothetical protein